MIRVLKQKKNSNNNSKRSISNTRGISELVNDVVKRLRKIIYDVGRQNVLPSENPINIGDIHEGLSNINAKTKQL